MRPNTVYKNNKLRWIYIKVNHILKIAPNESQVNVSWYRQDERSGELISLDLDENLWIKDDNEDWVPLDDLTTERVMNLWRPN